MRDYYKILGLERGATQDQIKKAFRDLAKKFHPDVNKDSGAEARFKEINEAYAVLSDPEKKKQYDTFGAEGFSQRFSQEDIFRNFDFQSVFNDLFGGMGGGGEDILSRIFGFGGGRKSGGGKRRGGRSAGPDFQTFSFGGNPFGGQFRGNPFGDGAGTEGNPFAGANPFGGAQGGGFEGNPFSGGGPFGPQGGKDAEAELTITLDEAVTGGKRRVNLGGGGASQGLEITIPPGVRDGQKLRLAGKGSPGGGGMPAGDLLLRIRVAPHPLFRIEGDDLVTEIDVPLTTLVLGGTVEVPTADGTRRRLKVREGTPNRARLRIREQGLPRKGSPRGDLHVVLHVLLPDPLTEDHKTLFEKLRDLGG